MSQRTRSATERIYCWSFDCIEMMVSSLFHDYLVSGISKKQFTESLSYMIKEQLESLRFYHSFNSSICIGGIGTA